ncbi:hypothetical protein Tco_1403451 [Tanacetum coccineum]
MADSSSHKPSSSEITPKEEPITLDKLESPNPLLPADQVEFIFEEIAFTTNNKVALIYRSHPNSENFREVSNFISKCCLKEAFIRAPTQYKEYLSEFWYTAKTLDDSKIWVSTPTGGIRGDIGYNKEIEAKGTLKKSCLPPWWRLLIDYARLIGEDIIHKLSKKTREKVIPYPRFISLLLEYMMPKYKNEELTINPTQAICNLDVPVDPKAPKPSSQTEETEVSKSKTGQSEKETQSSLAKDKSPSHTSPPTPVVGEMHKEAQQAASGPTSLGATRYDASADSTTEADPGLSAPNESIPSQQDQTKSAKDGLKIVQSDSDTRSAFFTPDSLQDEPIIILDDSEEEDVIKDKDTHASSHDVPEDTSTPHPPSLKSSQIQQLMAQVAELKNIQWELLAELQALPVLFSTVLENASDAMTKDVPLAGQANVSPAKGEKNITKDAETNLQDELVDFLGIDVVKQYHNKKLLFDKYCDKMLKIIKSSKIINCDVITQKGPISLKVYREDETIKVIANLKVGDLHLAE